MASLEVPTSCIARINTVKDIVVVIISSAGAGGAAVMQMSHSILYANRKDDIDKWRVVSVVVGPERIVPKG